jgi:4-amino-4-deoxy-L-arabinose transferase-like glycosyltransferase
MTASGSPRGWLRAAFAPKPDGWADVLYALALGMSYVALLLASVQDLGYARDEGFYFDAARSYEAWFVLLWSEPARALAEVDAFWAVNHEHPALVKSFFALSHRFLGDVFAMEGTSYRFAGMCLSGLAVAAVYLWGARARGRLAGLVAAASLAAMPRFFYHAHLACFDAPIVAMWLLCAYSWWRALEKGGVGRILLVGVSFALALNTKHNAWFLPIVCGLHALMLLLPGVTRGISRRRVMLRAAAAFASMATIGPLLFVACWPWLWHDTLARLREYALFHLHHVYYNMEFLGDNYWRPPMPRSYAFVMTAATVPLITLALFAAGAFASLRRNLSDVRRALKGRAPVPCSLHPSVGAGWLWLFAMAVQYAAWLSPTTPIFGGTKHWMTAYPFLALFAGAALRGLALGARRGLRRSVLSRGRWLELALVMAALLPPILQAGHIHPWALSGYNVLVGGAPGAATLGLNRTFWGYTSGAVVDHLNAVAPRGARIYIHDTAAPAWAMLLRDGRLRADLRAVASVAQADIALYHHEKHMSGQDYQAWVAFGTVAPFHVAGLDGVPVIWLYRAPMTEN